MGSQGLSGYRPMFTDGLRVKTAGLFLLVRNISSFLQCAGFNSVVELSPTIGRRRCAPGISFHTFKAEGGGGWCWRSFYYLEVSTRGLRPVGAVDLGVDGVVGVAGGEDSVVSVGEDGGEGG